MTIPKATHATGVIQLRPKIDRQAEAERCAEVLHASIEDRHRLAHRGGRDACPDPVCQALTDLQTAARR